MTRNTVLKELEQVVGKGHFCVNKKMPSFRLVKLVHLMMTTTFVVVDDATGTKDILYFSILRLLSKAAFPGIPLSDLWI